MAESDQPEMGRVRQLIARHAEDADEEWELLEMMGMT